jgi:hypothetical protein
MLAGLGWLDSAGVRQDGLSWQSLAADFSRLSRYRADT